ncbi:MAG: ABC transporter ATP-binding protein [Caldilineaceae bacterium]
MTLSITQYTNLLASYLKPQRMRVLLLAGLFLSGIVLQLLSPQFIRRFIDLVQTGGAQSALYAAAGLFLAVAIAQRAVDVFTAYVSQHIAWTATNNLRRDLTRHVLGLDMAFHNVHTPGELLERIDGDVDRLANFFSQFLLQILSGVLLTVGVLLMLSWEDWRIGALLTLFVVAYLLVHYWDQKLAAPAWQKERRYDAELSGFVEERLAGLRDIQTSGAVNHTLRRFDRLLRRHTWQNIKADVMTDVGWTISKTFYDVGTVAGMGLGAYLYLNGAISLGTVYLIVHYLELINGPLNRIGRQLENLQQVRVAAGRIKELTDTQSPLVDGPSAPLPTGQALGVCFDNVHFGYRTDTPVLRDISFKLEPGQKLGLLGRTGSGKTTISRLLFRLYDVDGGHVRLNGVALSQLPLRNLRQRVALVTQEVQLFPTTVRNNLALFDKAFPDTQILAALAQLGLTPWLARLPHGLDTMLSADGTGLSAGEAQLLALCRVFLKDPGLVILDEASSRLDPTTERLLERALDELLRNRTAIVIAHRLATVRRADRILILENGAVKESGPYAQLAHDPDSVLAGLLRTGLEEILSKKSRGNLMKRGVKGLLGVKKGPSPS